MIKQKWIRKKEYFLKIAKKVFYKKGLISSNIEDIAVKAGTSRTALYYYYKSKNEIIKEILKSGYDQYIERAKKEITTAKSEKDVLYALYKALKWQTKKNKEFLVIALHLSIDGNEMSIEKVSKYYSNYVKFKTKELETVIKNRGFSLTKNQLQIFSIFLHGMLMVHLSKLPTEKIDFLVHNFINSFLS